jgi:hypothetical protein
MTATMTASQIQLQLDEAIATGNAVEVKRLSVALVDAHGIEQTERLAEKVANERTAAVNMQRITTKREHAQERALAATRQLIETEAPKVRFEFGQLRVVVTFRTSDPGLVLAASEAIRQAAVLMQRCWLDRLQAARHAGATEAEPPSLDAETAAMAFRGALHYAIQRGLVQVQVQKKRRG